MLAEFIYQPKSGQYDEKTFDLETIWRSPNWCWVRFTSNNGEEWVGSFRGTPLKTAVAEDIQQVAVLTDDCIYILDIDKRILLFHQPQTQFCDLIDVPTKDKFLLADHCQIGILGSDFKFQVCNTEYDMDYIKFITYEGYKLNVEIDLLPDYNRTKGYVDTKNWTIVIE